MQLVPEQHAKLQPALLLLKALMLVSCSCSYHIMSLFSMPRTKFAKGANMDAGLEHDRRLILHTPW